jgi:hypothetical protein
MSRDNPLWGAPRIHGELLKLGIDIAQSTIAKYMLRRRGPPSPGWRAFLRNHSAQIAAIDLFVIPTIGFKPLYGLVILRLERRRLVWTKVTGNPTAEWSARQITEAFPWDAAPRYLIRDRDTAYGVAVTLNSPTSDPPSSFKKSINPASVVHSCICARSDEILGSHRRGIWTIENRR